MTEAEWKAGNDVRSMLDHLGDRAQGRKGLLFATYCCRRVWDRFHDARSQSVVEVAELLAEGGASQEEFLRVAESALAAWQEAMRVADRAEADALKAGAGSKNDSEEYREARRRAWGADPGRRFCPGWGGGSSLADAVSASTRGVAGDVSNMAYFAVAPADNPERLWQGTLLNEMFGNPFRPVGFDPGWRTSDVVALTLGMNESRDFTAMPILADALQDAGCDNEDILNHCRDASATHVRGCWVVDLVLSKE
jgi:hypothetical protein